MFKRHIFLEVSLFDFGLEVFLQNQTKKQLKIPSRQTLDFTNVVALHQLHMKKSRS